MFERLKWLLPALTLLVAMIMLSASSRHQPDGAGSGTVVMEIVGPVESLLSSSARAVGNFWNNYLNLANARRQNAELMEVIDRQRRQIIDLAEYKQANERLTSLLEMRQAYPHLQMRAAHVLAWDPGPWFRSVVINVGSSDGVAVNQPVVHNRGAVGRIIEVSPNYARVLLVTDYNSSVDAFVQRSRAVGILSGQNVRPMNLKYVRKDEDVRSGDMVVTSGLDGLYPRGVPLGTVGLVNRRSADMFIEVEVLPEVPFDRLEEVLVIINQGPPVDWLTLSPTLRPLLEEAVIDEESRRRRLNLEQRPQIGSE